MQKERGNFLQQDEHSDSPWCTPGQASGGPDLTWLAAPYRGWTERFPGHRGCGYLCSCTPLEVLHAAGLTPVRLLSLGSSVSQALGCLPSFCCALAQGTTERLLRGELAFLEWVVTAHCCDTLKSLHDIWSLVRPELKPLNFSVPIVVGSDASGAFTRNEIRRLATVLGSSTGVRVNDERLRQSIALYNTQRLMVAELYNRSCFPYALRWALALAGMLMPVEAHLEMVAALKNRSSAECPEQARGPRVVVTGTTMDELAVPQMLDELGFHVVADDLCTGQRAYAGTVDEQGDPVVKLAEYYDRRDACPGRHSLGNPRSRRLVYWARAKRAQGVVLMQPKYCDPCAFDDVQLIRQLRQAKLPHVVLETEVGVPMGQLRTRLQAFAEVLRAAEVDGQ